MESTDKILENGSADLRVNGTVLYSSDEFCYDILHSEGSIAADTDVELICDAGDLSHIKNAEFICSVVSDVSDINFETEGNERLIQCPGHEGDDYVAGSANVTVHREVFEHPFYPFRYFGEAAFSVVSDGVCSVGMRIYHKVTYARHLYNDNLVLTEPLSALHAYEIVALGDSEAIESLGKDFEEIDTKVSEHCSSNDTQVNKLDSSVLAVQTMAGIVLPSRKVQLNEASHRSIDDKIQCYLFAHQCIQLMIV